MICASVIKQATWWLEEGLALVLALVSVQDWTGASFQAIAMIAADCLCIWAVCFCERLHL